MDCDDPAVWASRAEATVGIHSKATEAATEEEGHHKLSAKAAEEVDRDYQRKHGFPLH